MLVACGCMLYMQTFQRPNTLKVPKVCRLDSMASFLNAAWGRRVDYIIDHVESQPILSHVASFPNISTPLWSKRTRTMQRAMAANKTSKHIRFDWSCGLIMDIQNVSFAHLSHRASPTYLLNNHSYTTPTTIFLWLLLI